jgi:hypothetical protein
MKYYEFNGCEATTVQQKYNKYKKQAVAAYKAVPLTTLYGD